MHHSCWRALHTGAVLIRDRAVCVGEDIYIGTYGYIILGTTRLYVKVRTGLLQYVLRA